MIRPTRPYRAVRAFAGLVMVLGFFGVWAHGMLTDSPVGTFYEVVTIALVLAGAYAVLGKETVAAAVEDAQEIAGEGSDEQGGDDQGGGSA
ncbi:hypothetical protein SAMN05216388_1001223 [Halorientalis persicus]|uniref:Uncharacterized protein n=1 Tax=Halorientalis persicus TaxID=1367881 RepID=A0A1H8D9T0_9EURY|nr:hypothetical protein [Halorientalis persicus]SEN04022.1 hypothetical protein SAMN05216388_1001223 [Halorientalis persicus]